MKRRDFIKSIFSVALAAFIPSWARAAKAVARTPAGSPVKPIPPLDVAQSLQRLGFGSCALQNEPQPIWDTIGRASPQLFVMLGDNIYADTQDVSIIRQKYGLLAKKPEFVRAASQFPIVATWDDHDFGVNDGGREYPVKQASKDLFMDFFSEPPGTERRTRPGVYTSYMVGPVGQRTQIILMDLRWFRSPLVTDAKGAYIPNPDAAQQCWGPISGPGSRSSWPSPPTCASSAAAPSFRPKTILTKSGLLIISGDMHWAELSYQTTPQGRAIWDLTSSGLNRFESSTGYPNRFRKGVYDQGSNFGFVTIDWDKKKMSFEVRLQDGSSRLRQEVPLG